MKAIKKRIGVDVGGSHVAASIIDMNSSNDISLNIHYRTLDSKRSAVNILQTIGDSISELLSDRNDIESVGIAFPGPFDYEKGVSAIAGVGGKFSATFGLHVGQALKNICGCSNIPFHFSNDAHCFAVGANRKYDLKGSRKIFLTIGTGFGSAFMEENTLLENHPELPASGAFYNQPFLESTADDYFSTRWFLNEYFIRTGKEIASVQELASLRNGVTLSIFRQFGLNLGSFLLPWIQQFECDELLIGGNITKAYDLFASSLFNSLLKLRKPMKIIYCNNTEECILTGAAYTGKNDFSTHVSLQKIQQSGIRELPTERERDGGENTGLKNYFLSDADVHKGFSLLAQQISHGKKVMIDGVNGIQWDSLREQLNKELVAMKKNVFWYDINSCRKSSDEIEKMTRSNISRKDNLYGKKYTGQLNDFFDKQKIDLLRIDQSADISIVYGTGAALCKWDGILLFADLSKSEIQSRMKENMATNIGFNKLSNPELMDKRFFYIDLPVISRHKKMLLSSVDYIIDTHFANEITWMEGTAFRNTLTKMWQLSFGEMSSFNSESFENSFSDQLNQDLEVSDSHNEWSFEALNPENGIVIEGNSNLLRVSYDYLLNGNINNSVAQSTYVNG